GGIAYRRIHNGGSRFRRKIRCLIIVRLLSESLVRDEPSLTVLRRVWRTMSADDRRGFLVATVPVEDLRAALALLELVRYCRPPVPAGGGAVRWNDKNLWRCGGCYPLPAELHACLAQ